MQEQVNIDIQIDVLQVESLGQVDAVALQRDIERELSTLMAARGLPSHQRESHSIAETAIEWGEDDTLAVNIAAAVYQALGQ